MPAVSMEQARKNIEKLKSLAAAGHTRSEMQTITGLSMSRVYHLCRKHRISVRQEKPKRKPVENRKTLTEKQHEERRRRVQREEIRAAMNGLINVLNYTNPSWRRETWIKQRLEYYNQCLEALHEM